MADHDTTDIRDRSERGRNALLQAMSNVSDELFILDPTEDEWSAARNLRHVAWVEYYWTLAAMRARNTAESLDLNREVSFQIAVEASRLAGTPEEVLPKPPPYTTKSEAVKGLEDSRHRFQEAVDSLTIEELQKQMAAPWGTLTVRWAIEHIVEHDWDHAVQLTGLGRQITG